MPLRDEAGNHIKDPDAPKELRALNWSVKMGLITRNPIHGSKVSRSRSRVTYFTPEQENCCTDFRRRILLSLSEFAFGLGPAILTLDIRHVEERLWTAGRVFHAEGSDELEAWVEKLRKLLYASGGRALLRRLRKLRQQIASRGPGTAKKHFSFSTRSASMSRFRFELATESDDAQLRGILAATPMPGRISVTFRREPSYFAAAEVDGSFRQVVICRDHDTGRIIGFGSRSVREMYVNGTPTTIGYLSMLRVLEPFRNRGLVARGYKFFRELHGDGRAALYLTTIADGNERALAMLTSGRAGLPRYHCAGRYLTAALAIPRRPWKRQAALNRAVHIRPATDADQQPLVDFLRRVGPRRQFFPTHDMGDFFKPGAAFKDLTPSDLLLAFRDGRLVGTLGGWDQRRFRQTIVEGYHSALGWMRPFYNCWAQLRGWPGLPRPGAALHSLMGALLAVENDNPQVFQELVEALLARAAGGGHDYLLLGLHEADPLLAVAMKRAVANYVTRLYHVCWEDGDALRHRLDQRPPYLEPGCL